MKDVETPQANIPVVDATGALTTHGLIVLQKMAEAVRELQERVEELEALHP